MKVPTCRCMQRVERCVRYVRCVVDSRLRRSLEVQSFDELIDGVVSALTGQADDGDTSSSELGGDRASHASHVQGDDPAIHPVGGRLSRWIRCGGCWASVNVRADFACVCTPVRIAAGNDASVILHSVARGWYTCQQVRFSEPNTRLYAIM